MNAEDVPDLTIPQLTATPRPELEEAYVLWRRRLKESKVGSEERTNADKQMQRLLAAMRGSIA